jgi:hypothetical protein
MTEQLTEFMPNVAARAKEIDPEAFVSWWEYGSIMDPYNTGYDGEDNSGRVWWVTNADGDDFAVTGEDYLAAHPSATWDDIYFREVE